MRSLAAIIIAVVLAPGAIAQHQTFNINPDSSDVKMTLNTTHELVHGIFHIRSGSIQFDHSSHSMSGSVVVIAGSGKTGNDSRDKRMNKEILQVDHHTIVSFEPRHYTGEIAATGDSSIQVTGVFTLLDTPHEITIPLTVHLDGTTAMAKAHFSIPYIEWGLKDPSFLFWKADKDVAMDISLAGQISK